MLSDLRKRSGFLTREEVIDQNLRRRKESGPKGN
jgi:hypothetical protein